MKAVVITARGGFDRVQAREWPDPPPPGPGQVRITVRAAGANFADTLARVGLYPDAPPLPTVLGYEVAGEVESVGPDVAWPAVGDRVIAATMFGGQAEIAVVQAANCLALPVHLSFEEGAATLVSYATSWAAAMIMGGVREGDTVLVHSAGGGAGMAATQVAFGAGARVIATASPHKHDAVLANGASAVLDHHDGDWTGQVRALSGGKGVDVALDPLGPSSFRLSYQVLRPGGRLVMFGLSQVQQPGRLHAVRALRAMASLPFATAPWWNGPRFFGDCKGVFALNMLAWWTAEGSLARVLPPVAEGLATKAYRPVVAEAFGFSGAAEAHRCLQEARNIGKVVLVPD